MSAQHSKSIHSSTWIRFFPFLLWLKGYTSQDLRSDGLAGLTVAVVLIPQSMAYAMLAGCHPSTGFMPLP